MKKIELTVALTVLGALVASQIFKHDHETMAGHDHDSGMAMEANEAGVTLAVSGMT